MLLLGSSGMVLSSGGWTLTAWVQNLRPNSLFRTLFRGSGTNGNHPVLTQAGTDLLGTFENGAQIFFPSGANVTGLVAGAWHHIAAVGASGQTTFYINGTLVGVAGFQSTTDVYAVGNYQQGNQVFSDYIDELWIWSRALTSQEVNNVFEGTLCPSPASTTFVCPGEVGL